MKNYLYLIVKGIVLGIIFSILETPVIYYAQTKITGLSGVLVRSGHILLISYLNMVLSFLIIEKYNKSNLLLQDEK